MNENKNTIYDFPTTQVRYEIDSHESEEEEKPDPNFIRHMYLMRTNGKYCLINTNYDCVYVPEPVSGMSGFMMPSKKYHVEYDKFYRKIGEPWVYQLEYKSKFYQDLAKNMYYTITTEQWKKMTKPRPMKAIY